MGRDPVAVDMDKNAGHRFVVKRASNTLSVLGANPG